MGKIKRSLIKSFLNVDPGVTDTYALIGEGVTSGAINYNPQTSEENYIHEDNARVSIEGYAPNFPIEMTAFAGTDLFSYLDGLRKGRSVLDAVETYIVNVWLYEGIFENNQNYFFYGERQVVSIQIDSFGGDGGVATKINYTVNFVGDPELGTVINQKSNPLSWIFYPVPSDGIIETLEITLDAAPITISPTFDPEFIYYGADGTLDEYVVAVTSKVATDYIRILFHASTVEISDTAQGSNTFAFTPEVGQVNKLIIECFTEPTPLTKTYYYVGFTL